LCRRHAAGGARETGQGESAGFRAETALFRVFFG